MKDFKQLVVWQKAMEVVFKSYELVSTLPSEEKFGLKSQITRSAVSIPSNIAEGSSRKSDKDYSRFLEISLGSAFELETQLLILRKLKMVNEQKLNETFELVIEIQKMLSSFTSKLKTAYS